jgi:hypothetical protein
MSDIKSKKCDVKGVSYLKSKKIYEYWIAQYQNKDKNIKKQKSFSCNKYGFEKAKEMAIKKRKEWENKYGKIYKGKITKEKIKKYKTKIKNIQGIHLQKVNSCYYFEVYIGSNQTKNYSIKKYGFKKAFNLAIQKRDKVKDQFKQRQKWYNYYKFLPNKDYFILIINNKSDLYEIKIDLKYLYKIKKVKWYIKDNLPVTKKNEKNITLGHFLFSYNKRISHKNRNTFDYRKENLVIGNGSSYQKAQKYKKTEQQMPGVSYYEQQKKNIYKYWRASYKTKNISKSKSFSCNKYGYDGALEMAINKRLEWENKYGKNYEDIE